MIAGGVIWDYAKDSLYLVIPASPPFLPSATWHLDPVYSLGPLCITDDSSGKGSLDARCIGELMGVCVFLIIFKLPEHPDNCCRGLEDSSCYAKQLGVQEIAWRILMVCELPRYPCQMRMLVFLGPFLTCGPQQVHPSTNHSYVSFWLQVLASIQALLLEQTQKWYHCIGVTI